MVTVGKQRLSSRDFEKVIYQAEEVTLDGDALGRVDKNFQFLKAYAGNKIIYGINTGLGPMAQYKISEDDQRQLQYNLIRSHCSGTGKFLLGFSLIIFSRLNIPVLLETVLTTLGASIVALSHLINLRLCKAQCADSEA